MSGDIHLYILLRVIRICTYVHCILLARAYVCPCIALHVHMSVHCLHVHMFARALHIAYTCNVLCYYCL